MKTKYFSALCAAVATFAANNPDGFTLNLATLQAQTTGKAVARIETQNSFNESGLKKAVAFALANNIPCIGGWLDNASGLFYYDATEIYNDADDAKRAAQENEQIAFFDLDRSEEIRL